MSERTASIKKAAKQDRVKSPTMKKETVGPETKKIVSPQATANFKKALQFVQKAWWEVDPNTLNSREMKAIQKSSQAQGLTIHSMVKNQVNRVKQKIKSELRKGLKKYSLTTNSPATVKAALEQAPFSGLQTKALNDVINSYLGITEGATPVERASQVFVYAGELSRQIQIEMDKQQMKTAAPSRVRPMVTTGQRSKPKRRRVRAEGLPKKPRKRSKPRKKRAKKVKQSTKPAVKAKTEPKTALQKWNTHKRSGKKMRL